MSFSDCSHGSVVRVQDVVQHHPPSNTEHVIQEIHDILLSYYELARNRFVDNMRMQVTDYFLVAGPDTPLKIFTPAFVTSMNGEQLEDVAGEDTAVRRKRTDLSNYIKLLESAKKILQ